MQQSLRCNNLSDATNARADETLCFVDRDTPIPNPTQSMFRLFAAANDLGQSILKN
jgi:hypothetical protein